MRYLYLIMLRIEGSRIAVIPNWFILHHDEARIDQFPASLQYKVDFLFDIVALNSNVFHKRVFKFTLAHVNFTELGWSLSG